MGSLGAVLEITLVSYILAASVIGFYTTTFFKRLIPRIGDTPLTLVSLHMVLRDVLRDDLCLSVGKKSFAVVQGSGKF